MNIDSGTEKEIGERMKVVRSGKTGRVLSVDDEWGRLFPHKGPMIVLDIDAGRNCYSRCELDLADQDVPGAKGHPVEFQ